ncbi:hypothetical protein KSF_004790 [Reticulibacter mediterranei]|uniref:DUF998 domain-containing protein n=1 Tax=Reticulibacter mediterranei TaxID=2778369 RepID=A0A8J3I9K2_9CHLR|nr:DUF998 domain-containing protein [Reticulibacter mediterranei]GHO90431.1 hypothetical protein KSF_004790 [Reticulibacter mediterranei]
MQTVIKPASTSNEKTTKWTRTFLVSGVITGPFFAVVSLIQAFTRPGFDLTRHVLSLLENGNLGWLQISTFLLSGLLFVVCAIGMRQTLYGSYDRRWVPLLIGMVGAGMIGAGCFTADPGLGFPPGTPISTPAMSWHGFGHMIMSLLSFLALIAASCIFARRFFAQRKHGWALYSLISGILCFITLVGLSTGHLWITSAFVFTMLNGYIWISIMAAKLLAERTRTSV